MAFRHQPMGVTVEDLSKEEIAALKVRGYGKFDHLVRVDPGGAVFPPEYRQLCEAYRSFAFRSDDVVVMSYPRSGSTWTREILWAMKHIDHLHLADLHHVNKRVFPVHYDTFSSYNEIDFSNFLEIPDNKDQRGEPSIMKLAAAATSPRIIASTMHFSHFHPDLLDFCKVVYVARNPKDVCLSSYLMYSRMGRFEGNLSAWTELFTGNSLIYGPYWQHLRQAWARRGHQNLHVMFYEDMKADILKELKRLNSFLETFLSDDQLLRIKEHTEFEKMKAREKKPFLKLVKPGGFYQGGQVGAWSSSASAELDDRMNAWIAANCGDLDLPPLYNMHKQ